ncbi:MAG: bifunctional precorrin-2 dehydrogenase/sirohydrochlorin ferrochelatase [Phycisphaerae bacterium]
MPTGYPITLDLAARTVVIVGGGRVAARKARGLLDAGARCVRVVAPEILADVPEAVERVVGRYHAGHLDGAALVFAATDDPAVNRQVVADAHERGLWVNRADADEEGGSDFSTPATHRDGELVVTVSAGGSPALAARARDEIAASLAPRWSAMAEAMQILRPRVLASGWPIEVRRSAFRALARDDAMTVLAEQGLEAVWQWCTDHVTETSRTSPRHSDP